MNILFAEDDKFIRDSYREFLKIYFDEVFEAEDGLEALEVFESKNIDVLLIDINMPKLNGIDCVKKIRQKNKDLIVIMITAYDDKEYLLDAIRNQVFSYLIKPVNRSEFINAIKEAIEKVKFQKDKDNNILLWGSYTWSINNKRLSKNGDEINLTKNERLIFELFCSKNSLVFSNEDIFYELYDFDEEYNENKVRMIIKRLKQKIGSEVLKTVYGQGYSFVLRND